MEHDTIDISTSQIKSVAPFPPVINDLNFGLVGPGPQPGWTVCPNLSIQNCDNEFKSTGPNSPSVKYISYATQQQHDPSLNRIYRNPSLNRITQGALIVFSTKRQ
jgi:hypothetical protein